MEDKLKVDPSGLSEHDKEMLAVKEGEKDAETLFFEKAHARVLQTADLLENMGFKVCKDLLTPDMIKHHFNSGIAFPLVMDGLNGIRCTYKFSRWPKPGHGELKVWYTNSFENYDNPKRLAVEERLVAEGLKKQINTYEIILD